MNIKAGFLSLLTGVVFIFSACNKDSYDPVKQAAADDAKIVAFIDKNSISAVKHASGLYYQIITPCTGAAITASSTVSAKYKGTLLNGNVFDESSSAVSFPLTRVIEGWTIGIPLIKVGGKIRLIIPSTLGYGNYSPDARIPKNSVLDFTVEVVSAN